jgi:phosphatidylglycerophosphate synthase
MGLEGRKLPSHLECPVDNLILEHIVEPLNPVFKKLGATPNILTAISGVFGLLAVYHVQKSNYSLAALFFGISYIFDCFDGNFARRYNMVTRFGDWFDHMKDTLVAVLLISALYFKQDISNKTKVWSFVVFVILSLLSYGFLNLQERHYHKEHRKEPKSETLGILPDVFDEEHMDTLRHFGCGTLHAAAVLMLVYLGRVSS